MEYTLNRTQTVHSEKINFGGDSVDFLTRGSTIKSVSQRPFALHDEALLKSGLSNESLMFLTDGKGIEGAGHMERQLTNSPVEMSLPLLPAIGDVPQL